MDSRLDMELSLAPGFLVTFAGARILRFPHLREPALSRARPETVALVAELSRPAGRSLGALIEGVTRQFEADHTALVQFVGALDDAAQLIETPTEPRFGHLAVADVDTRWAPELGQPLQIRTPTSLVVEDYRFLWFDHDGSLLLRLNSDEVRACMAFAAARSIEDAWKQQRRAVAPLTRSDFDDLVGRLLATGRLSAAPQPLEGLSATVGMPGAPPRRQLVQEAVSSAVEEHDRKLAARAGDLVPVIPVNVDENVAPAALGLLVAYAQEFDGGRLRDRYDFVPEFLADEETLLARASKPSIFLFSNYVWTLERNLALSALAKQLNPANITIHGGPSTPKYEQDADFFFAQYAHVDVTVRNEGEATFAELLDALDPDRLTHLDTLRDVRGLTFRSSAGSPVRTEERERIAELDTIPSPYLLGLLDPFGAAQAGAVIETNRGCPYGCTFCDWGSATLSRIRKFSLERVFAELEWSARNTIDIASIADANFGIFERDVEIAEKIAELKRAYGFPRTVAVNYAKNTVKHLRKIIEIFADVEILTEGVVSLQSMDEPTLKIIRRSNIKLEKYNELTTEFRRARLPLAADIMMGLPGSTPASFREDLQQCTDRDVRVRANPTQLLPNSPMNDPDYRREHGIVAKPGELVKESASFTRSEWDQMDRLRMAYYSFDNWGVLRYVARYVRQEVGLREVDFYDRMSADAYADPAKWPSIVTVLRLLEGFMAPPGSWGLFIDEVGRYLISDLGVTDDSALRTVLLVQLGQLPAADREFPLVLHLPHDFVAWQEHMFLAREDGHRADWERVVPALRTFPEGELAIADPNNICRTDVGKPMGMLGLALRSWELDSMAARPRLGAMTTAP